MKGNKTTERIRYHFLTLVPVGWLISSSGFVQILKINIFPRLSIKTKMCCMAIDSVQPATLVLSNLVQKVQQNISLFPAMD